MTELELRRARVAYWSDPNVTPPRLSDGVWNVRPGWLPAPHYRLIDNTVHFLVPNCGFQTLEGMGRVCNPEPDATTLLRDPLERMLHGFVACRGLNNLWRIVPGTVADVERYAPGTWEQYVNRILSGEMDDHWVPQAELADDGYTKHFVPFDERQLKRMNPTLTQRARSNNYDDVDPLYRIGELRRFYAADLELAQQVGLPKPNLYHTLERLQRRSEPTGYGAVGMALAHSISYDSAAKTIAMQKVRK